MLLINSHTALCITNAECARLNLKAACKHHFGQSSDRNQPAPRGL